MLKPSMKCGRQNGMTGLSLLVMAGLCALSLLTPAAPASAVPDRPTLTPTPGNTPVPADQLGAGIAAQAPAAWAGRPVEVQWQAGDGRWQTVAGWRGTLDAAGQAHFWAAAEDQGTGPFRWAVRDAAGPVVGISAPFTLPVTPGGWAWSQILAATPWSFELTAPAAFRANPRGCGQLAIAGQVLDAAGRPLGGYQLRLTHPDGEQETVLAGGAPDYGPAGFGFLLGRRRPGRLFTVELLDAKGPAAAAPVTLTFTADCGAGLAWIVFRAVR